MFIPDNVKVGPFNYSVKVEPTPFLDETHTVLQGQCDHGKQIIRIWERHPEQMYVTLWHEILHAMAQTVGIEMEEEEINRMAPILVAVLFDNEFVIPVPVTSPED